MRFDQLAQPPIDLLPDLSRHHGFERGGRYLDCEIARALVTDVDDAALRTCSGRAGSDQETRHRLDRLLGGGEADAQQSIAAERGQAFQRKCQMSAALVRRHRMNLVDDDGAGGREHRAPADRAEQHVQRFRRRDDDVRRGAPHALALARRRIAGSNPGSDIHIGQALLPQRCANAGERSFQVALDVVGQGLERGDVDDLGLVCEITVQPLPYQGIDRREKGGQRLARAGRCGDQHVTPRLDGRPGLRLRRSRRGEAAVEPRRDRGMKQGRKGHEQDAVRGEHQAEPELQAAAVTAHGSGWELGATENMG